MINFKLYYKKTIPNTANLVEKTIKGLYININKENVIIDNIIVAKVEELHSVDFIVRGYKNVIEF